jgi:hypothetical protein
MSRPIVTYVNADRLKISDEATQNRSIVTVRFDQDITHFKAMLNGVDQDTGVAVDEQSAMTVGSMAVMKVSSATSMTVKQIAVLLSAGYDVRATIDWNEGLSEGTNRINFYGRNSAGEWTLYNT